MRTSQQTRLLSVACLCLIATLIAGCTERNQRQLFDGKYYPAKVRHDKAEQRNFTASVTRANRGIEGAKQAVVHEATRYCLQSFGTSEIIWAGAAVNADDGVAEPVYQQFGDRLSVSGRCVIWR